MQWVRAKIWHRFECTVCVSGIFHLCVKLVATAIACNSTQSLATKTTAIRTDTSSVCLLPVSVCVLSVYIVLCEWVCVCSPWPPSLPSSKLPPAFFETRLVFFPLLLLLSVRFFLVFFFRVSMPLCVMYSATTTTTLMCTWIVCTHPRPASRV